MEAKRDETERDDAKDDVSVRFVEQEQECTPEALDLARVMVESGLDDEPTDNQKDDTSGEHAETAKSDREIALCRAHLRTLEIPLEDGTVCLNELAYCHPDRDQADQDCQQSPGWVIENRCDHLLG